jgi:CRISPR system Cascade subunit CasA
MPEGTERAPTFNLWDEPWITLERREGGVAEMGIGPALAGAPQFAAIHDPSPLVVVGIHRLLTAILQYVFNPETKEDIKAIWEPSHFPEERLADYAARFRHRFDLFSESAPFYQSADLPMAPPKGDTSSVAYLAPEAPTGNEHTHFRHGEQLQHAYCPPCCAAYLTTIPAFANTGGRTFTTSINGTPPIYVLPGGDSLFESLVISIMLKSYLRDITSETEDQVWWTHDPVIGHCQEITKAGYLHSLTFPARRVRLYPEPASGRCSRCGRSSPILVRQIKYQAGERWRAPTPWYGDPFVAYKKPGKNQPTGPRPVMVEPGRALWREYSSLFLQTDNSLTIRPRLLEQLGETKLGDEKTSLSRKASLPV